MVFHGWTQFGLQQAIDEVNRLIPKEQRNGNQI
jgi:hypothetical protein